MNGGGNIEAVALLQKWLIDRCNGAWEHSWGVAIETLDNPGWIIKIDLKETARDYEHLDQSKSSATKMTGSCIESRKNGSLGRAGH
jgi:hypothetical protein